MSRSMVVIVSMLLATSEVVAQSWIEFLDPVHYFGVNLPEEPDIEETEYVSAHDAAFPATVYTARAGDRAYSVTVVDYTDAQRIHAERPDRTEASRNEWIKDVRASVAHAAWSFRKRGGDVTYDAWSDIERVEGHQLQITNEDGSRTFAGIYLHDSRLYILEANVPPGWPPPLQFQQSLRFFDEQGRRVRYELEPSGNVTRIPGSYEYEFGEAEIVERNAD